MSDPLVIRLARAKWAIMRVDPFIGYLASEMPSIILPAKHEISTAATNYRRFYYNEAFCAGLNDAELTFVVIHECLHVLWAHGQRRGERIHELFNIAADHAINLMIVACFGPNAANLSHRIAAMPMDRTVTPPEPIGCLDKSFKGLVAEEIYERLHEQVRKQSMALAALLKLLRTGKGKGKVPDNIRKLLRSFDPASAPSNDPEKEKEAKESTEAAIARALSRAVSRRLRDRVAGTKPSDLERMAQEGFTAQARWDQHLRAKLVSFGTDNSDWSRPHKKYLGIMVAGSPMYLPRRTGVTFGDIVMIIDTSGSILPDKLGQFIAETNALLNIGNVRVHLYTCDTEVHALGIFTPTRRVPSNLVLPGGGGTDFRPAFALAEALDKRHALTALVYLTDTYGTFPEKKPRFPTVWLIPDEPGQAVPFGKTINVRLTPAKLAA